MTEELDRLLSIARDLNADERRVLLRIAERLAMGRRQYGALDIANDPRDWTKEASEEVLDLSVYMAIRLCQNT